MDATVTQGWLIKVIFQGIEGLFKEQDDVLFLVCEVLQALVIQGEASGPRAAAPALQTATSAQVTEPAAW